MTENSLSSHQMIRLRGLSLSQNINRDGDMLCPPLFPGNFKVIPNKKLGGNLWIIVAKPQVSGHFSGENSVLLNVYHKAQDSTNMVTGIFFP